MNAEGHKKKADEILDSFGIRSSMRKIWGALTMSPE